VHYQASRLVQVSQTVAPLQAGQSYTIISGYEYFPNGSYSIHFQSGLTLHVPLGEVSIYSLHLWEIPGTLKAVPQWAPDYGYNLEPGRGFYWNSTHWVYGRQVPLIIHAFANYSSGIFSQI